MQLVGLQRIAGELDKRGVALFGISYDDVSDLRRFADGWGVRFPLLADRGSELLQRIGMVDLDLAEHAAEFGLVPRDHQWGVAYPGVFVLDEDGLVVEKHFERNYRERRTAETLLEQALGTAVPRPGPKVESPEGAITVTAALDSPTYTWYSRLRLDVHIDVDPGWHLYDGEAPPGMQSLELEIAAGPGVLVEPVFRSTPQHGKDGHSFHVGAADLAYDLVFAGDRGGGERLVRIVASFQACSDTTCLPPATRMLELPVVEVIDPLR